MTTDEAGGTVQWTQRTPNTVLRGIRENERHETRPQFAEAMARLAREMGEDIYPDENYVYRLESGAVSWPNTVYRNILVKLCERPAVELGFIPPMLSANETADNSGEPHGRVNTPLREAIWASGVELTQFARKVGVAPKTAERWITRGIIPRARQRWRVSQILGIDESELWPDAFPCQETVAPRSKETSSSREHPLLFHSDGATPDDEERIILAARNPRRHDPGVVDSLATVLSGQRRLEDAAGSALLIEPVNAELTVVRELVTEARGDLRTKVLDIGSQWAQFSGWLSASTGRLDEANQSYRLALEWALEADQPNMVATALNMQGTTAWLGRKAGPMIGLSRAAQRDNRASPGVLALAVQQEARGIALSGEAKISDIDRKFDHARALVSEAAERPENEPPWIYFFSTNYLILQRGLSYKLIGEYAKAIELLTAGLSAMPADVRQTEYVASYLLDLAISHAKQRDIDSACAVVPEVNIIAKQTNSAKLRSALAEFYMQLEKKWPNNTHVIELGEALRLVIEGH